MPAHFQLDSNDITRGVATEWVGMLLHIVARASDRAYYHVQDSLQHNFGEDVASDEEANLSSEWATSLGPSGTELFRRNVILILAEDGSGKSNTKMRLSYGHEMTIQRKDFLLLTRNECLTLRCPSCSTPILTQRDHTELTLPRSVHEAEKCVCKSCHWTSLDIKPSSTIVHVHETTVLTIFQAALLSFDSTSLLCPADLSFVYYDSTKGNMQSFKDSLFSANYIIRKSSMELITVLMQDALESQVGGDQKFLYETTQKPGYMTGLSAWSVRVVNFIIERKYGSIEPSHLGCHYHGRTLVQNPIWWEAGDEGEEPTSNSKEEETTGTSCLSTAESEVVMDHLGASMSGLNVTSATSDSLVDLLNSMALVATVPQGGTDASDKVDSEEL